MTETHLLSLDEELLQRRLISTGLYSALRRVETTGSTNAELIAAAQSPDFGARWPHMSVLTAEEQTGGRGRLGRTWSSPKSAALATSILLRPTMPASQWHWLSLAAGLALVRALAAHKVTAALKWPNDVHVKGRKIAGLLAEVPPTAPQTVIIGCGINVLLKQDQLPTDSSTSLLLELERGGGDALEPGTQATAQLRTQLLADWLEHFAGLMRQAQREADISGLRNRIIAAVSTTGQQVRVELPDGTAARGRALGVAANGALEIEVTARRRTVLDAEAGGGAEALWQRTAPERESYTAGDVVHLRPTPG